MSGFVSIESNKEAFEEQRKSEIRVCSKCNFRVDNPFIERCPRCFSLLSKASVDCDGCVHKILCPTGKNSKFNPQQSDLK